MAIKYYKDGEWKIFPGTIGPAGKGAYEIAQEGGYTGTKEEFTSSLVNLPELSKQVEANTEVIENLDLGIKFEKVDTLPASGDSSTIYLVPVSGGADGNVYAEYLYINNVWENIGSTQVDLTGYATESWVSSNYQTKGSYLTSIPAEYITETELDNKNFATKSELEGLTPDLSGVYTKDEIDAKGFLTSVPDEYVTETELSGKNYATKSEIPTDFYSKSEVDQKISEVQAGSTDLTNYYTKGESDDKYALKTDVPTDYVSDSDFETYKTEVSDSYYDTTETKRVVALTQEEYDSLTDKDENALYFVVDEEGNVINNSVDGDLTVSGTITASGDVEAKTLYEDGESLADKYLAISNTSMFAPANNYYTDSAYAGFPGICDLTSVAVGSMDISDIHVSASEPSAVIITGYESDITFGTGYAKSFTSEDTNLTIGYKCYAITYVNDGLALVNFAHYN